MRSLLWVTMPAGIVCTGCEQSERADSLVGARRRVSRDQRTPSGDVNYPCGMTPGGRTIYTADGQMSAHLMNPGGDLSGVTASGTGEIIGRTAEMPQ